MPKITVTGQPPSSIFGSKEDWANARTENSDFNAKVRFQQAQERISKTHAYAENADYDRSSRFQESQGLKNYRARLRFDQAQERIQRAAASAATPSQHRNFVARHGSHEALGSLSGAYYNQESRRLGRLGNSAINKGDLRELVLIDRHLSRMDKNLEKYTKANTLTSQEQEANRKKAREVLSASFSELSSAADYAPGFKGLAARAILNRRAAKARAAAGGGGFGGGYGGGYGGVGAAGAAGGGGGFIRRAGHVVGGGMLDLLGMGLEGAAMFAGPVGIAAGLTAATAGAIYEAPNAISDFYGLSHKGAQAYLNLRRNTGAFGVNSGLNSTRLRQTLFNGRKVPAFESNLGIGPEDAVRMLQNYGISPLSTHEAVGNIKYIAGMRYKAGLAGLGDKTYEGLANTQTTLGINRKEFSKEIGEATGAAVVQHMDRASVLRDILQVLKQNAATGGFASVKSAVHLYNRMASSGAPGARTGAMQMGLNSNLSHTLGNMGNNPVTAMPLYRAIQAHGGLTTKAQEESFFGKDYYAQLNKTAGGRRYLQDILAAQSPYVKMRFAGEALQGNHNRYLNLVSPYTAFHGSNQARSDLGRSASTGATIPQIVALKSGSSHPATSIGHTVRGKLATASPAVMAAIHSASKATGVSPSVLYGIFGGESSFNSNAVNRGHAGLGQMSPAALKQVGMNGADMSNPQTAALASAKYYKYLYKQFSGVKDSGKREIDALIAYYWGIGHKKQILAGNVPQQYITGTDNKLLYQFGHPLSAMTQQNQQNVRAGNRPQAVGQTLNLIASQKEAQSMLKVLTSFNGSLITAAHDLGHVSKAAAGLVSTFEELRQELKKYVKHDLGPMGRFEHNALHPVAP